MLERDPLEIFRQTRRGERPVPVEIRSPKPSPANQIIERTVRTCSEQVAFSVADPQQLCSGNGNELWLTFNQNQFCRFRRNENFNRFCNRLTWYVGFDVFPVLVVWKFCKAIRKLGSVGPRTFYVSSSKPGVLISKVVKTGWTMLENVPVSINSKC